VITVEANIVDVASPLRDIEPYGKYPVYFIRGQIDTNGLSAVRGISSPPKIVIDRTP